MASNKVISYNGMGNGMDMTTGMPMMPDPNSTPMQNMTKSKKSAPKKGGGKTSKKP